MSPTARSLATLRELGYTAAVTEHWNPHAKIRQDLYGFIDVLAVKHGQILAIQATTTGNAPARCDKAAELASCFMWLQAGGSFEVWGWALRGARGERKLWTCKRYRAYIGIDDAVGYTVLSDDVEAPCDSPKS